MCLLCVTQRKARSRQLVNADFIQTSRKHSYCPQRNRAASTRPGASGMRELKDTPSCHCAQQRHRGRWASAWAELCTLSAQESLTAVGRSRPAADNPGMRRTYGAPAKPPQGPEGRHYHHCVSEGIQTLTGSSV